MQLMKILILQAAFITFILFEPLACSDDLILFDEFHFSFDLLNENDWDQYHINDNEEETQNTFDYRGRRLIEEFDDQYYYNEYSEYDEYDEYDAYDAYDEYDGYPQLSDEYALKCTNRIPVIFKHLCVHWDIIHGFTFNYRAKVPQSSQNNYESNWFYSSRNDKIASAKNAGKYYNILDGETWSMSDDKAWNEIDWISSLNPRLNDDEMNIPNDDVFKQCRFKKAIEECAHYDINNKILTFTLKVPKGRYQQHTSSHHLSSPANMESSAAFEDIYNNYFYYYPMNMQPQQQQIGMGPNSVFRGTSSMPGSHGGTHTGIGAMFGQQPKASNPIDMAALGKMTNLEEAHEDLDAETFSQLERMVGASDPFNVRRRLYDVYEGDYGQDEYDYDESSEDDGDEQYDALDDSYFDDDQYADYNKYDEYRDSYNNAMEDDYGDRMESDGYDFNGEFEYGDMLGYDLWKKDTMGVNEFACLNCDKSSGFRANAMDDNEMEQDTFSDTSDYSLYGDYMYYFDEHLFDFAEDKDWKSNNGDLSKCSVAIPGLHHKLCVDHDNGKYQVRFSAATNDEMDDTYYQLYGYDEYYYNNVLDDLDDFDDLYADYYDDYDYDEENDEAHDDIYDSDEGYYNAYDSLRQIAQRRQLSSEEDHDEDVPHGYDEDEYGDADNGYDDEHPMEGMEDAQAKLRREELAQIPQTQTQFMQSPPPPNNMQQAAPAQPQQPQQLQPRRRALNDYYDTYALNNNNNNYAYGSNIYEDNEYDTYYDDTYNNDEDAYYDDAYDNDDSQYMDYFDAYYGMNNDDNYYYMQQNMEAHELLDHLQYELGDLLLAFEDNTDWDEVSDINQHDEESGATQRSTRKCKTLQSVQICATMQQNELDANGMKLNVKVGRHKYHRSPFYQSAAYKDMLNDLKEVNKDNAKNQEFDYDLKLANAAKDKLQSMHWIIDHNIMDVMDDDWNDALQFKPTQHMTHNGHTIIRKCKGAFCLCQYIGNAFDGNMIHPCKPMLKADKTEVLGPGDLLNLVNVMDTFLAPVHVVHRIPTINIMHHPIMPLPPQISLHGIPMLQRIPYAHILRLRAIPPRNMFVHPFRGRKFQNPIAYRQHKHNRIPWHKYRRFGRLMPPVKPVWLPQWIWMEVNHNMRGSLTPRAEEDMQDYYDYDEEIADYYEDLDNNKRESERKTSSYGHSYADDDYYQDDKEDDTDKYYDDYDADNPPAKDDDDDEADLYNNARAQLYNNLYYRRRLESILSQHREQKEDEPAQHRIEAQKLAKAILLRNKQAVNKESMRDIAQKAPNTIAGLRRGMLDYYDYLDEDDEDEILDRYYDKYDDEWLVVDDTDDKFMEEAFGFLDFEDDSIWDEIMMNIKTLKGRPLAKKCMKLFGRTLCICEFMDWLNGKIVGGNTKHICYSSAHKSSAITKKTVKQMQNVVIENETKKTLKVLTKIETQEAGLEQKLHENSNAINKAKQKEAKTEKEKKDLAKKKILLQQKLKKKVAEKKKKEKKPVIKKKIIKKKISPHEQRLVKERDALQKEIVQTVKEHKVMREKNKKIAVKKLKVNKMANMKVQNGHHYIMKEHKVLMKQMKQLDHLMKKVRSQKGAALPNRRPVWLPHYFWHWLHHFPHFHQLHLNHRLPWISSAAHMDELSQENDAFSSLTDMKDEYYYDDDDAEYDDYDDDYYDDEEMDDYEDDEYEDAYDSWLEAMDNYAKAYTEYNDAVNAYVYDDDDYDNNYVDNNNDDAFAQAAENYAHAYLEYNDAYEEFDNMLDDYNVDDMVSYILNGETEEDSDRNDAMQVDEKDYYYDEDESDDEDLFGANVDDYDDDEYYALNEYEDEYNNGVLLYDDKEYEQDRDDYDDAEYDVINNEQEQDSVFGAIWNDYNEDITYDDDIDDEYDEYDDNEYNDWNAVEYQQNEYQEYEEEIDDNYDDIAYDSNYNDLDSDYSANVDNYYADEEDESDDNDAMSAWTGDDNNHYNAYDDDNNDQYEYEYEDVSNAVDNDDDGEEFKYEYEYNDNDASDDNHDFDDDYNAEESEDADALVAALEQTANDGGQNPYWVFELIFLVMCGVAIVCTIIYVQKQEWIETLREMNQQRVNSRKYGFNRINVVFDTEDNTGSDESDWGLDHEANKMMYQSSDSGDEHLGSHNDSPINESEIYNMIQ